MDHIRQFKPFTDQERRSPSTTSSQCGREMESDAEHDYGSWALKKRRVLKKRQAKRQQEDAEQPGSDEGVW